MQALRRVLATRYVIPLREGGSLPAIVEADDLGHYVIKFRGAAQGLPVLIAELICGELGLALGLPVPEIVLIDLDASMSKAEPDPEIQDLLRASVGLNLALDFLPGSVAYQPARPRGVTPALASAIVWFDSLIMNVDRTAKNPNMVVWHDELWLIDHGAALYVHHAWNNRERTALSRFAMVKEHLLLPMADDIAGAAARLRPMVTPELIAAILMRIPDEWLAQEHDPFSTPHEHRAAYREFFAVRMANADGFTDEAIAAASGLAGGA